MPTPLDQFEFHQRLADTGGAALVMFGAVDCGSCRHLGRVILEVQRRRPDWAYFEVDAQRDAALTHEFEVFHLPTLFLFSDGEFHCELRAEARPGAIIGAIEQALCEPPAEAP
jgi:thioredoxin-like negative regulator of GroEL